MNGGGPESRMRELFDEAERIIRRREAPSPVDKLLDEAVGTPERLSEALRRDAVQLYWQLRELLVEKLESGECSFGEAARLADRLIHWMRVIDDKPTEVRKHWLEQLHQQIGHAGIEPDGLDEPGEDAGAAE